MQIVTKWLSTSATDYASPLHYSGDTTHLAEDSRICNNVTSQSGHWHIYLNEPRLASTMGSAVRGWALRLNSNRLSVIKLTLIMDTEGS